MCPQAQLVQLCGVGEGASSAELRTEVVGLLASLSAAMPAARNEELRSSLAEHFGEAALSSVLSGSASLEELRLSSITQPDAVLPHRLPSACSLAAHFASPLAVAPLGELTVEHAVRSILGAPLLVDLEESTDWCILFEPTFGDLRAFCVESSALSHLVLELRHRVLVRVEAGSLSDFRAAASSLQATRAVAVALFLCSQASKQRRLHIAP